jgi:hypothetical protein
MTEGGVNVRKRGLRYRNMSVRFPEESRRLRLSGGGPEALRDSTLSTSSSKECCTQFGELPLRAYTAI